MKKLLFLSFLFFVCSASFSQTKKPATAKKTIAPKPIVDCLVNSSYYESGFFYKFYSNGTGVVGKSPSFSWKYLGKNIVLVKYDSDFFADDRFRVINPGSKNCDIMKIN
jgi:hypothetical protein